MTGAYGALIIQKDGSYVYTPDKDLHHPENVIETFEYQLRHPNQTTAEAKLDITLEVSGAGVVPVTAGRMAFSDLALDLDAIDDGSQAENSDDATSLALNELISEPSASITLTFEGEEIASATDALSQPDAAHYEPSAPDLTPLNDEHWNPQDQQIG